MQFYSVTITDEALLDLFKIYYYISNDLMSPEVAKNTVNKIRNSIKSLNIFPYRNKLVSCEPWASKGYRQLKVNNFIVCYSCNKNNKNVIVLRVFYGKCDIQRMLKEM